MALSTQEGSTTPHGPSDTPAGQRAPDRVMVASAMSQLPAQYRAVLRRACYEHWTTAQIADDLQITDATVKTRLHFALRALQSTVREMLLDTTTTNHPQQWDANLSCRPGAA